MCVYIFTAYKDLDWLYFCERLSERRAVCVCVCANPSTTAYPSSTSTWKWVQHRPSQPLPLPQQPLECGPSTPSCVCLCVPLSKHFGSSAETRLDPKAQDPRVPLVFWLHAEQRTHPATNWNSAFLIWAFGALPALSCRRSFHAPSLNPPHNHIVRTCLLQWWALPPPELWPAGLDPGCMLFLFLTQALQWRGRPCFASTFAAQFSVHPVCMSAWSPMLTIGRVPFVMWSNTENHWLHT